MDLSWTIDRADDASLVRCRVRNDAAAPRRVRIESRFDAPVLPPRRGGVPADGWDASGVTLRVGPGQRRGFGFAVPAPPVDPPVEIVDVEPVDEDGSARGLVGEADGGEAGGSTAADALRDLAEHRPPRAAVYGDREIDDNRSGAATIEDAGKAHSDAGESDGDAGKAHSDAGEPDGDAGEPDGDAGEPGEKRSVTEIGASEPGGSASDAIDAWFAAVETRVDRAERLTDADVATATAAVADAGGIDALADLDEAVDADAERLRAVSERAASLAERAAATDAPVEALERLA